MIRRSVFTLLLCLFIYGCNLPTLHGMGDQSAGFVEPEPELYVELMPAVREYFHYRKQAVISGSTSALFSRYPSLSLNADVPSGVNNEAFTVDNYRSLKPFDGNIHPEYYERMQVRMDGIKTEILLHGMELYLWRNETGSFDESGGEFKIILHMQRSDSGWEIAETDEVTQAEWLDFKP